MDWHVAPHEHQASPGSYDLEKRGKSTPEWSSTTGMTRRTTTTTTTTITTTTTTTTTSTTATTATTTKRSK